MIEEERNQQQAFQEEAKVDNGKLNAGEKHQDDTAHQDRHRNQEANKMCEEKPEEGNVQHVGSSMPEVERSNEIVFDGGALKVQFKLKKYSIKITVVTCQQESNEEKPQDLQDLFQNKSQSTTSQMFSVTLTKNNMTAAMKKYFKSLSTIYNFIYDNIKQESNVVITKDEVKLSIPSQNEQPKWVKLKLKELYEAKLKQDIPINIENIEEKLLQFNNQEMMFIDNAYQFDQQDQSSHQQQDQFFKEWMQYLGESDSEEELLQKWTYDDVSEEIAPSMEEIQAKQKEIEGFQKQFPSFKKPLPSYPSQTKPTASHDSKVPTNNASSAKNSVFPPGYVPPHLAKQTAPDGLTSDQHLRFQANQTKKEKLKLAKQLLKMGYSTAEVISKLEEQERGGARPNSPAMTNSAQSRAPPARSASSVAPSQQSSNNNDERAVREMLISLIKAKTYKRLDDIQRHMASQGIQTTITTLKRIIDEIKAKNAQRKAQNQTQNSE